MTRCRLGQLEFEHSPLQFDDCSLRINFCRQVDQPQYLVSIQIEMLDLSVLYLGGGRVSLSDDGNALLHEP